MIPCPLFSARGARSASHEAASVNQVSLHESPPRILVVEDNSSQHEFLLEVLDSAGYLYEGAKSIAEGVAAFERGRYACAVVDLGLPDGNGRDLLLRLGEEDPSLVRIVLTGESSAQAVIDTMRAGAFDYLTKPVRMATVTAAVSRAVAHHRVLVEREELVHLLYEEREQLRARVEEATADIRAYAGACETSNARLRALLHLSQSSGRYSSEEVLLRSVFDEVAKHLPLRCLSLCDRSSDRVAAICIGSGEGREAGEPRFLRGSTVDLDRLLAEPEPGLAMERWAERLSGADMSALTSIVHPLEVGDQAVCTVAFFMGPYFEATDPDREFLDMCGYLLAVEWERGKLLFRVAHHASLGGIAVELARNFVQPLTAIRMAADCLKETVQAPGTAEGVRVIRENVERLRIQTQEFRRLSLLREDAVETVYLEEYVNHALDMLSVAIQNRNVTVERDLEEGCECVLLNGAALARTFLDLILEALRTIEVGGHLWLRLYRTDADHVAFEIQHDALEGAWFAETRPGGGRPGAEEAQVHLGLQLAERSVQACGGTINVKADEGDRGIVCIVLPRNAAQAQSSRGILT